MQGSPRCKCCVTLVFVLKRAPAHNVTTARSYARARPQSAIRRGRIAIPFRGGTRSVRRVPELPLLVVAHDRRLSRSEPRRQAERERCPELPGGVSRHLS